MPGKRTKRKGGRKGKVLPKEDLEWLSTNTNFPQDHIVEWHKGFMSDCPDGKMDRAKMKEMFSSLAPADSEGMSDFSEGDAADLFLDQMFRIFDKDGDGTIDFKEFMIATDMTSSGDPEEKLRWAFRMYDKDSSGYIDLDEMIEIFVLMYNLQGFTEEDAVQRAHSIFESLDCDGDGTLGEEEFIKGCMNDDELLNLLNPQVPM